MKEPWLSIIIPIYNPPLIQLQKCVDSAAKVGIPTEILLIDDGSESSIKKYCDQFNDKRIKYIYQKNQGVSSARTRGIKEAKGKYIYFLDSDDEIPQEWGLFMGKWYKECSADWVLFDVLNYYPEADNYRKRYIFQREHEILDRKMAFQYLLKNANLNECWGKLIRREFLIRNNIIFPNGVAQGEDRIFNCRIIHYAKNIEAFDVVGYIYRFELKNTQRLLRCPEKYFSDLSAVYSEDLKSTEIYNNIKEREEAITEVKITVLNEIGSAVLKLMEKKRWTTHEKMLVTYLLQDQELLALAKMNFLKNLKIKVYYIFLKYKMWSGFRLLVIIKKMQTILRGKNATVL